MDTSAVPEHYNPDYSFYDQDGSGHGKMIPTLVDSCQGPDEDCEGKTFYNLDNPHSKNAVKNEELKAKDPYLFGMSGPTRLIKSGMCKCDCFSSSI